jgi:ribose transport system ATP-binding protein
VVASSDAKELEGLCDTVYVMSRGQVVQTLHDGENREEAMIKAAVTATTKIIRVERENRERALENETIIDKGRRFLKGDYAPAVMLGLVMVVLAAYILGKNAKYLSDFNIGSILILVCALGFIAIGQTTVMMTGGIDLSVGPLAGLMVVIASFFINDGSPVLSGLLGLATMLVVGVVVGVVNSSLIRFVKFTAIAATLTTYIAIGGFSFILRSAPEGYINQDISKLVNTKFGPIPAMFIVLILATVGMEYLLRKSRWGWQLRAVGSNEESARRIGVPVTGTIIGAYVVSSLFVFLGAIMLMVQIGVGDASQGVGYTLTSITAVVLGGTSLMGGRGTYVGTLFGAILLIQVMNATVFLDLNQTWQYLLQAALILVAAVVYSLLRSRKNAH